MQRLFLVFLVYIIVGLSLYAQNKSVKIEYIKKGYLDKNQLLMVTTKDSVTYYARYLSFSGDSLYFHISESNNTFGLHSNDIDIIRSTNSNPATNEENYHYTSNFLSTTAFTQRKSQLYLKTIYLNIFELNYGITDNLSCSIISELAQPLGGFSLKYGNISLGNQNAHLSITSTYLVGNVFFNNVNLTLGSKNNYFNIGAYLVNFNQLGIITGAVQFKITNNIYFNSDNAVFFIDGFDFALAPSIKLVFNRLAIQGGFPITDFFNDNEFEISNIPLVIAAYRFK